jgi:hypothetical protein
LEAGDGCGRLQQIDEWVRSTQSRRSQCGRLDGTYPPPGNLRHHTTPHGNMKPPLLRDICYFESSTILAPGDPFPDYAKELYPLGPGAVAVGQRIACKCAELSVSIGNASHLYICLTPALQDGQVLQVDFAFEKWHLLVMYGVGSEFNSLPPHTKIEQIREGTFAILHEIAPSSRQKIEEAHSSVCAGGEDLRIVVLTKRTKTYAASVSHTVPVHPAPARVFLAVTKVNSGQTKEVELAQVKYHDEVAFLADRIAIVGSVITVHPRKSSRASLITHEYPVPLQANLAELFRA